MTSLWHSVTSYLHPSVNSAPSEPELPSSGHEAAVRPASSAAVSAPTEPRIQTVGLEDPNAREVVDDPAIFDRSLPIVKSAPADGTPSKTLIDSKGKPYINPADYGGSNINKTAAVHGEPLNVIISALSSPEILTRKGLQGYLRSLGLDVECLGLHSGDPTYAWLDPRGWVEENFLYREVYTPFDHVFGTCLESLVGGNHIRAYQQQGSGAWFFAASKEMNVSKKHMIVPDGYNLGRDLLVKETNQDKGGVTSFVFKKYQTKVEYISGLMPSGSERINHGIAVDGRVALLTVTVLGKPNEKLAAKEEKRSAKRALKAQRQADKAQKRAERAVRDQQSPTSQPHEARARRTSLQIAKLPWKKHSAQLQPAQTQTTVSA